MAIALMAMSKEDTMSVFDKSPGYYLAQAKNWYLHSCEVAQVDALTLPIMVVGMIIMVEVLFLIE